MKTNLLLFSIFVPLFGMAKLDMAAQADDAFQQLATEYIDKYLEVNPEQATQLGDHRFDDRLTNYSDEAIGNELSRQKEFREKLNSLGDGS